MCLLSSDWRHYQGSDIWRLWSDSINSGIFPRKFSFQHCETTSTDFFALLATESSKRLHLTFHSTAQHIVCSEIFLGLAKNLRSPFWDSQTLRKCWGSFSFLNFDFPCFQGCRVATLWYFWTSLRFRESHPNIIFVLNVLRWLIS